MPTKATISYVDYDGEVATTSFWVQDVAPDGLNYSSVAQDADEVKDAIAPLILGQITEVTVSKTYHESYAKPSNAQAQREQKWLVRYRDTTQFLDALNAVPNPGFGKVFTLEIPTAELTGNLVTDTDRLNIISGDGLTLKNSLEANIRSPYNFSANAPSITVLEVIHVGRNN